MLQWIKRWLAYLFHVWILGSVGAAVIALLLGAVGQAIILAMPPTIYYSYLLIKGYRSSPNASRPATQTDI